MLEEAFAVWGVGPPGAGGIAVGLVDGGHDGVEEAGVVAAGVDPAPGVVDLDGILAGQLVDAGDAGAFEVCGDRGADVHEVGEIRGCLWACHVLIVAGFGRTCLEGFRRRGP